MTKNITSILFLTLILITLSSIALAGSNQSELISKMLAKYGTEFTSLEHKTIGDMVELHGLQNDNQLTLANGIVLSYGEIIMFAGDMFGDPAKPISSCSKKDRVACFNAQFATLALDGDPSDKRCVNPINQVTNIKKYLSSLEEELQEYRKAGQADVVFYRNKEISIAESFNRLTCGGTIINGFIPFGNYIKLAERNYDHFGPDALKAYKAGHRAALNTAVLAFQSKEKGQIDESLHLLELAYAQNAFANHYLTDSFAAGHMRVPRRAIANQILLPATLNLLISNLMHSEDNEYGINVVNAEGMSWTAYGDDYLFSSKAQEQRDIMMDAMQRSADGVYLTYMSGEIPKHYPEMDLAPDLKHLDQLDQTAPLFKVEQGVLLKRVSNHNMNDYHWTKYWSGLFTLMEYSITK